jgi:hypothetical protein
MHRLRLLSVLRIQSMYNSAFLLWQPVDNALPCGHQNCAQPGTVRSLHVDSAQCSFGQHGVVASYQKGRCIASASAQSPCSLLLTTAHGLAATGHAIGHGSALNWTGRATQWLSTTRVPLMQTLLDWAYSWPPW